MIAFRFWSRFGAFKDPLSISQNITFSLPPKTAIGGIIGGIIGKTPDEIFNDDEYFNFGYSAVLLSPTRKKSFAQNYISKYTERSYYKINAINKCLLELPLGKREKAVIENFKFEEEKGDYKVWQKPTYRELLLNPNYLIIIQDFKYEKKLKKHLQNHYSVYPVYMGNSEFSANFSWVECTSNSVKTDTLHSFTQEVENIDFRLGNHYTSLKMATKSFGQREYRDYKQIVVSDKAITLKKSIEAIKLLTPDGQYYCEFI